MIKTMPYSLYKASYAQYKGTNYNKSKKTIDVDLPEYKKPSFPKTWVKRGNSYHTPNGCTITFWNTGLAENFYCERWINRFDNTTKTIHAGLYAREQVIAFVESFN